jgi:hypothetical protein
MTQTDYAKHANVSRPRIHELIGEGLPTIDGKIDRDAADAWIAANLDPERRARYRPAATHRVETIEARRQKMLADAGLAKLKLRERKGALVSRELADKFVFEEARKLRDAWLAWAARSAPALAHELGCDPQSSFSTLDRLVREHLLELSEGKTEWPA